MLDRIKAKVSVDADTGCWVWSGCATKPGPDGYGLIRIGGKLGKTLLTHRVAYELLVGPIPEGLDLDHLCRVRRCCNPEHLEPVTRAENCRRGALHGTYGRAERAKTHCPQGHPYSGDNVTYRPSKPNARHCRTCDRARARGLVPTKVGD